MLKVTVCRDSCCIHLKTKRAPWGNKGLLAKIRYCEKTGDEPRYMSKCPVGEYDVKNLL